jgi:zinc transport system substrate-binding protein
MIAQNIYNALIVANPENEVVFTANYDSLIEEIENLDNRISEILSGTTQRNFMVYHPAWGYFADAYGLNQLPIQTGGTDPSASELAALIDQALEEGISVIFVQPQFSEANANAIAQEIGGEVVKVDPLAYEWLSNLEIVADAFASALDN